VVYNNRIVFRNTKYNGNVINFDRGIPEKILIDGESHNFEYYQDKIEYVPELLK
jgi:hypothetical protein